VLLNLLSNAVKYNAAGGSVRVSCDEVTGARLRIGVTDTGSGIAPEKLERLFTPFDRLGAEEGEIEGTGLGLALSKHLVEAMGGTLHVETRLGVGSTFGVDLPITSAPIAALEPEEPAQAAGAAPTRQLLVLYVEDNLSNLRLVERVVARRPRVKLISAMQGRVGLDLAREHQPDLVLLDRHLPDLTGDDVLRHLLEDERTRAIPVVMLSADASPGQVQRLLEAGARDYLTKPLDVLKLLALLDETIPRADR
jgi:CheY-like chemotaxis protein